MKNLKQLVKLDLTETKKVKSLSQEELSILLGGRRKNKDERKDSIDVNSELASGGTTTDTYQ
jgi:hypothetical protein